MNKKILIVENEPDLAQLFKLALLQSKSFNIIVATEDKTALRMAFGELPDLIILDVGSPDMHGLSIYRQLREGGLQIPILIIGHKGSSDGVLGLEEGADDYLTKPFDISELRVRVETLLKRPLKPPQIPSKPSVRRYTPPHVDDNYNPYIVGAPVPPDKFYGRQQMIEAILAAIKAKNHVAIYGERRIGKTSLLHRLELLLKEQKETNTIFIPVFIQMQMLSEEKFFAVLMDTLLRCTPSLIKAALPPLLRQTSSQAFEVLDLLSDLETVIKVWNDKVGRQVQIVFLLDEGDRLNSFGEATQMQLRGLLQNAFINQHIRLVWCGVGIDRRWQSDTSPWFNLFKAEFQVDSLKVQEARRLVLEPVADHFSYEKKAVDKILEFTQNKPYLIQRLCSNCIDYTRRQVTKRRRITLKDVEKVWAENEGAKLANSRLRPQGMSRDFRLRQREYLLEISRAMSARLDLSALLELTLHSAVELLAGQAGLITLRSDDGAFFPHASIGLPPKAVPLFEPLWRDLESEENGGNVSGMSLRLGLASKAAAVPLRQVVALPLEIGGEAIGHIFIFRTRGAAFSSNDRQVLSAFADQAAIAVQNARLYQEVSAERDRLKALLENSSGASVSPSVSPSAKRDDLKTVLENSAKYETTEDSST